MDKKNVTRVLHIAGMTCTGCESRIENTLKKVEGIEAAKAIFSSSNVYITYNPEEASLKEIINRIEGLNYKVRNNPFDSVTSNNQKWKSSGKVNKKNIQLIGTAFIFLILYVVINNTVGFNFVPQIDRSMGYGILFSVGLLTSLHCIAMCGGINLSVCVQSKNDFSGSGKSKLIPSILYNSGRVTAYTAVGGMVGALGSAVSFSGAAKGIVAIISGVFMLLMGLNMLDVIPGLRKLKLSLPKFLGTKISGGLTQKGPFYVGLLNGLMPCGPLQAMQLYALGTGSPLAGAISMFLFSLGTVPLMFGLGAISSLLSGKFTRSMLKASAVLVMLLGLIMLSRGLTLSGTDLFQFTEKNVAIASNIATIKDGVQVVSTRLDAGRYTPIIVQKAIPVRWNIRVEAGALNGCNNPVTIPIYNIQKKLNIGVNIIEFTPEEEGDIVYTCWMGMISSNIKVVEDISMVSR